MTIARFLARRYNLAGKNDLEEAEADMLIDSMTDTFEGKWRFGLFFRKIDSEYFMFYRRAVAYSCALCFRIRRLLKRRKEDAKQPGTSKDADRRI